MKIQAVIFDLDGTLVDSMWMWKDIDIEYLGRYQIPLSEEFQREIEREIEGKSFQNMIAYTSSEDVKWQRKKFNPSLSGLRSITVPKLSVVTVTGKIKDIAAE